MLTNFNSRRFLNSYTLHRPPEVYYTFLIHDGGGGGGNLEPGGRGYPLAYLQEFAFQVAR